jgi:hypothetical protein
VVSTGRARILYVAGTGRSGSTLLSNALGQIDRFAAFGEIRFTFERGILENSRCGCGELFSDCETWQSIVDRLRSISSFDPWRLIASERSLTRLRYQHKLEQSLDAPDGEVHNYLEGLRALYGAIEGAAGADVIVDSSKLPSYARILQSALPNDVYVVHLVRNPHGATHSFAHLRPRRDRDDTTSMAVQGVVRGSLDWTIWNLLADRLGPRRFMTLRYEDLVREPRDVLTRVGMFVGYDVGTRLDFVSNESMLLEPTHTVAGNPNRMTLGRTILSVDERWIHGTRRSDRLIVDVLTVPARRRYGYRSSFGVARASVLTRIAPDWRRTAKANVLRARRSAARWRALPDVLIIGAKKAGTTALYRYLTQHPQVVPPFRKEAHYFDRHYDLGEYWYRSLFPLERRLKRQGVHRVTCDATPAYLSHPEAPRRAHTLLPLARLIAILRDPTERAFSDYQHEVRAGREHRTFRGALEDELRNGEQGYVDRGRYAIHLESWLAHYQRDQLLVLRDDDLAIDAPRVYREVVAFLGLESHDDVRFERHNLGKGVALDASDRAFLQEIYSEPNRQLAELLTEGPWW